MNESLIYRASKWQKRFALIFAFLPCFALAKSKAAENGSVIGFIWEVPSGPLIQSVKIPSFGAKKASYQIFIWQNGDYRFYRQASSGMIVDFPKGGVKKIKYLGVDPALGICAADKGFLTELTFASSGTAVITKTAITNDIVNPRCIKQSYQLAEMKDPHSLQKLMDSVKGHIQEQSKPAAAPVGTPQLDPTQQKLIEVGKYGDLYEQIWHEVSTGDRAKGFAWLKHLMLVGLGGSGLPLQYVTAINKYGVKFASEEDAIWASIYGFILTYVDGLRCKQGAEVSVLAAIPYVIDVHLLELAKMPPAKQQQLIDSAFQTEERTASVRIIDMTLCKSGGYLQQRYFMSNVNDQDLLVPYADWMKSRSEKLKDIRIAIANMIARQKENLAKKSDERALNSKEREFARKVDELMNKDLAAISGLKEKVLSRSAPRCLVSQTAGDCFKLIIAPITTIRFSSHLSKLIEIASQVGIDDIQKKRTTVARNLLAEADNALSIVSRIDASHAGIRKFPVTGPDEQLILDNIIKQEDKTMEIEKNTLLRIAQDNLSRWDQMKKNGSIGFDEASRDTALADSLKQKLSMFPRPKTLQELFK